MPVEIKCVIFRIIHRSRLERAAREYAGQRNRGSDRSKVCALRLSPEESDSVASYRLFIGAFHPVRPAILSYELDGIV